MRAMTKGPEVLAPGQTSLPQAMLDLLLVVGTQQGHHHRQQRHQGEDADVGERRGPQAQHAPEQPSRSDVDVVAVTSRSLAHDERAILAIERAASNALVQLRDEERESP